MTNTTEGAYSHPIGHLDDVLRLLVCPRCHTSLSADGVNLRCQSQRCGFTGAFVHDVFICGDRADLSFFDERHDTMTAGSASDGIHCLCYERQADIVETQFAPGSLVLDVGCGPRLPYTKPDDIFVIGLEASYESIRVNKDVDMRVYGSATEIPLPDQSVDTILAYYSVHHMTGQTRPENRQEVVTAFREFDRVVKPGGELLVFEVSPWAPFYFAEKVVWNRAKTILGPRLDMFFYSARDYEALGRRALPNATFSLQSFDSSMLSTFPPAFSLPWLRVPRFLYPFDVNLYRWRF